MNVWAQSFLSITNHPQLFVRGCCTIGRGENEWNGKDTWVLVWVFPEVSGPTHGNATLNIPWRRYPILLFLNSSDTVTYLINVCTYPFTLCHHIVQSERIFRPNIIQLQVRDGGLPCLFNQLTVVQWIFQKTRAFLKKARPISFAALWFHSLASKHNCSVLSSSFHSRISILFFHPYSNRSWSSVLPQKKP